MEKKLSSIYYAIVYKQVGANRKGVEPGSLRRDGEVQAYLLLFIPATYT